MPDSERNLWKIKKKYYKAKHVTYRCLPELWVKFKALAEQNKRSANAALNILMEDAIKRGKLPDVGETPDEGD